MAEKFVKELINLKPITGSKDSYSEETEAIKELILNYSCNAYTNL